MKRRRKPIDLNGLFSISGVVIALALCVKHLLADNALLFAMWWMVLGLNLSSAAEYFVKGNRNHE